MNMNGTLGRLITMAMRELTRLLGRRFNPRPARSGKSANDKSRGVKGGAHRTAAADKHLQSSAREAAKRARQAAKITRRLGK
jgi:hypothetical protein